MHVQITDEGEVDDINRTLLSLDGSQVYTLILWKLPAGKSLDDISLVRDVREYIQCAGSAERMRVDVRRSNGGAPEHFVVGRAPNGGHIEQTETIFWESHEIVVGSNEVFAAAEATELFTSYGRTGWVPSTYILRPLPIRATSVEQRYQDIGREAMEIAGDDLRGRFLVYAEVAKGNVLVCDLVYKNRKAT